MMLAYPLTMLCIVQPYASAGAKLFSDALLVLASVTVMHVAIVHPLIVHQQGAWVCNPVAQPL